MQIPARSVASQRVRALHATGGTPCGCPGCAYLYRPQRGRMAYALAMLATAPVVRATHLICAGHGCDVPVQIHTEADQGGRDVLHIAHANVRITVRHALSEDIRTVEGTARAVSKRLHALHGCDGGRWCPYPASIALLRAAYPRAVDAR